MTAFVAPAPVPVLLAGMSIAGTLAVLLDKFSPDALRWRAACALALYPGAALAYMFYGRYLAGVDATAWAEAIGGQQEAQATLSQDRSFLNTLATNPTKAQVHICFVSLSKTIDIFRYATFVNQWVLRATVEQRQLKGVVK